METPLTPSEKMAAYRARMRAQGLRPVQIWVPDTRSPEFQKEARRQSLIIAGSAHEDEIMDWIEAAADTDGWEA
jgi:hypothetical protein